MKTFYYALLFVLSALFSQVSSSEFCPFRDGVTNTTSLKVCSDGCCGMINDPCCDPGLSLTTKLRLISIVPAFIIAAIGVFGWAYIKKRIKRRRVREWEERLDERNQQLAATNLQNVSKDEAEVSRLVALMNGAQPNQQTSFTVEIDQQANTNTNNSSESSDKASQLPGFNNDESIQSPPSTANDLPPPPSYNETVTTGSGGTTGEDAEKKSVV